NDPQSAGKSSVFDEKRTYDADGNETTGGLGKLMNFLKRNARDILAPEEADNIAATNRFSGIDDPSHITNRTNLSINEIIPGYLARILQMQTIMTTGNPNAPLISYNMQRGGFGNKADYAKDIKK